MRTAVGITAGFTWLAGFTLSPELFPAHGHLWRLGGTAGELPHAASIAMV